MSLTDHLKVWGEPKMWDHVPTEDEVLEQFLFSAISDYLQTLGFVELDDGNRRSEWINEYAKHDPPAGVP